MIKEISGPVLGIVGLLFILSGTKLLGRRLNWRIGLGVPLFGLGLFILVTELPQYAIGFSVLATLALAFAAFLTIQNADEREKRHREEELAKEKRDRKERLLNEIIEWAEEIDKASLTPDLTLASKNTTLMMKQREVNVLLRYGICLSKATSIETIASVSFKDELLQDVRKVIDTLVKFICIKQLKSLGVMPTEKAIPAKAR
ncbi:MAG: hypothetical protein NT134_04605, partial [Chloroflexi bacterium]|nr:hypothetical protein [Chloroflexota bacterium]